MTTTPQHPFPMPGEAFDDGTVVAVATLRPPSPSSQIVVLIVRPELPYSYRVGVYDLAKPPTRLRKYVRFMTGTFIHFAAAADAFQYEGKVD